MKEKGRPPGRPPACPGETMTTLNLRLTGTQRKWLEETKDGEETLSAFARRLLEDAMRATKP